MSTSPTEVAFLRDLIAIPSISGNELPAAEMVEQAARRLGLDVPFDTAADVMDEIARVTPLWHDTAKAPGQVTDSA